MGKGGRRIETKRGKRERGKMVRNGEEKAQEA